MNEFCQASRHEIEAHFSDLKKIRIVLNLSLTDYLSFEYLIKGCFVLLQVMVLAFLLEGMS